MSTASEAYRILYAQHEELHARHERLLADIEQLAAEWEREVGRMLGGLWPQDERDRVVRLLQQCAAELRERAKGGKRG